MWANQNLLAGSIQAASAGPLAHLVGTPGSLRHELESSLIVHVGRGKDTFPAPSFTDFFY